MRVIEPSELRVAVILGPATGGSSGRVDGRAPAKAAQEGPRADCARGPRVYDWAVATTRSLREPGKSYWMLACRSLAKLGELAYYVRFGPSETAALEELVKVAHMAAAGP